MNCQRYPTCVKIIDNSNLPPLYICFTEAEAACPQSQRLLDRVTDSLREPGRIASLPGLAYVASLRMTRRLQVQGPGWRWLFRMSSGIEDICLWALRLSLRGSQSTPAQTAGDIAANEIPSDISIQSWDNRCHHIESWWGIVQRFRPEKFVNLASILEAISGISGSSDERKMMSREYRAKALEKLGNSGIGQTLEEIGLGASLASFNRLLTLYGTPGTTHAEQIRLAEELRGRIADEMESEVFLALTAVEAKRFNKWAHGWEKIIARFPNCTRDVEEMQKCFALGRYTASMFHALHVAEWGAIYLGDHIGVTDPKKSWGASDRKLRDLVKAGHSVFPSSLGCSFEFVEQMHREVQSMMLAWRHKVDHAVNHLAIVPNTDFTPDVAEHIIGSVRVFMQRLIEGIPTPVYA